MQAGFTRPVGVIYVEIRLFAHPLRPKWANSLISLIKASSLAVTHLVVPGSPGGA